MLRATSVSGRHARHHGDRERRALSVKGDTQLNESKEAALMLASGEGKASISDKTAENDFARGVVWRRILGRSRPCHERATTVFRCSVRRLRGSIQELC